MTTKNNVICSDPELMGGTPVFKGTRVPIKNLIDYLEAGDSLERDIASSERSQLIKIFKYCNLAKNQ